MTSVYIVTHGDFGRAILDAVCNITGCVEECDTIAIAHNTDLEAVRSTLGTAAEASKEGLIILVDVAGGSPFQLTSMALEWPDVRILAGLNMPMLLALKQHRGLPIDRLYDLLAAEGKKGILGFRMDESGACQC